MNRLLILPAVLLTLSGCNEKTGLDLTVTAESEPNDAYSDADNLGSIGGEVASISITADIEFDDGTNTDLQDHFIVLSNITGSVVIDLTPVDVAADLILIEEISASTDGTTFNDTGAGAVQSGTLSVTQDVAFHFRVECEGADTAYTIDIAPVASPATPASGETSEPTIVLDSATGEARLEWVEKPN